jgi:DNA-binding NtrC family response regulator
MSNPTRHRDEILIVVVEDNARLRHAMEDLLMESFPHCKVKTIAHGIEAMNYLLTPINNYDLVILDGKLDAYPRALIAKVNGPDVADEMKKKFIKVPVVLWTQDPDMLARFDEIYEERQPEIEKPPRKSNIEAVLTPIIESIIQTKQEEESKQEEALTTPRPGFS